MRRNLKSKSVVAIRKRDPRRGAAVPSQRIAAKAADIRVLKVSSIRRDDRLQHRTAIDPEIVTDWAKLMREGTVFPPITVWWDGEVFWLSDGFKRVAAAEHAGRTEIRAEVRQGRFADAQWDSYGANAAHGFRLTLIERQQVLRLALEHSNSAKLSDVQLAAHLHLSRTTFRRWKKELSWPNGQDKIKVVTRGETTYELDVTTLGTKNGEHRTKPRRDLLAEIAEMRNTASALAKDLLNVIEKWVRGQVLPERCLEIIENILHRIGDHIETNGATTQISKREVVH